MNLNADFYSFSITFYYFLSKLSFFIFFQIKCMTWVRIQFFFRFSETSCSLFFPCLLYSTLFYSTFSSTLLYSTLLSTPLFSSLLFSSLLFSSLLFSSLLFSSLLFSSLLFSSLLYSHPSHPYFMTDKQYICR